MKFLIKFILVSIIIYYILKFLFKKFAPRILNRVLRNLLGADLKNTFENDTTKKEEPTIIKNKIDKNDKKNFGEYVDFEEIKD